MPEIELDPTQTRLEELLRDALAHLYDTPQLQLHPLTRLLAQPPGPGERSGLTLHRLILEALEQLRPLAHVAASDPAWRPYFALQRRYVEGMELQQITEELGLSLRQLRREHARGLHALTWLIWRDFLTPAQRAALAARPDTGTVPPASPDTEASAAPPRGRGESAESHLTRELSRLGTGVSNPEGTSLGMALEGVAATLTDLLARQGVRLVIDLPDETPTVRMDRVVLRQILLNLLIHLLGQTPRGDITITAHPDAHLLEMVLNHPQRLDPTQTRGESGDRLSIAEHLLHLQEGELRWEVGEPTRCRLRLPIHQAPVVLVIDDNPDLIDLFRRYLADSACRVVGVPDSRHALEMARTLRPQAILLDVMMPELDGWELLQRFKVQPETRELPIVVCSVLREEKLAQSLGAAGFIAKPVTQQALKRVLTPLLAAALPPLEPAASPASPSPAAGHRDSP